MVILWHHTRGLDSQLWAKNGVGSTPLVRSTKNHLYCAVQADSHNPQLIVANWKSWCHLCDKCTFFVDRVDLLEKAFFEKGIDLVKLSVVTPGQNEGEHMGWKARKIFESMEEAHGSGQLPGFRWYVMADSDTFLYVARLRAYLRRFNASDPHWLGRRFKLPNQGPDTGDPSVSGLFLSGGAGFVLSEAAFGAMQSTAVWDSPACKGDGASDTWAMNCLFAAGVVAEDTRDSQGRERFQPFTPPLMVGLGYGVMVQDWYRAYTFGIKLGLAGVSDHTLSYHYCDEAAMARLAEELRQDPNSIGVVDWKRKREEQEKNPSEVLLHSRITAEWRPQGSDSAWDGPGD